MMFNYAVVKNGEIARFFPFTQDGIEAAYHLAKQYGYEIWETYNGDLYAMVHSSPD